MSAEPQLRDPGPFEEPRDEPRGVPAARQRGLVARILGVFIPVLVCGGGVAVAAFFMATRPAAQRTEPEHRGVPVEVATLAPDRQPIQVRASGTVVAAQRVVLQPEVSGRITWLHPELVPGGRVRAGEALLRIDARDYRAALGQVEAQLENSRLGLQQESSRQVIAEREWELLRREAGGTSDSGRELALRAPQTRSAQAQVRAAESSLQQARNNLTRTTVSAPFDALVQTENVDLGQLVTPAAQLATLVGTERFWVQVSVPMEQLPWIRVPGMQAGEGSRARVIQDVGESGRIERSGRVLRLLGDLDPVGRMARIMVEIEDPLTGTADASPGSPASLPLLLGAFVRVEIEAGTLDDVYEVPRAALHAGDVVHLLGADSRLELAAVSVAWRREGTVLVRGLRPGAMLVTSRIPTPIEGTLLQRLEAVPPAAAAEAASAEGVE